MTIDTILTTIGLVLGASTGALYAVGALGALATFADDGADGIDGFDIVLGVGAAVQFVACVGALFA